MGDEVHLWRLEYDWGIRMLRGLAGPSEKIAFTRDGNKVAIFSHNWEVGVWDTATGKLEFRWNVPEGDYIDNSALRFSPDGKKLVVSAATVITMWNLSDGSIEKQWKELPPGLQNELAFDENGRLLLVRFETTAEFVKCSSSNATERTYVCRVRNLLSHSPQKVTAESEIHFRIIHFIYFSNDTNQFLVVGNSIKTATEKRENYVFETSTGKKLWRTHDNLITRIGERENGIVTNPIGVKWEPVVRDFLTGKVIRKFLLPRGHNYGEHGDICVSESDPKEKQQQVYRFFRESESNPFLTLKPDRQPESYCCQFGFGNRLFIWCTATGDAYLYDFRKLEL